MNTTEPAVLWFCMQLVKIIEICNMFWGGIKSYKQQNKAKLMDSEMGNYLKDIFDGFKFYGWANPGRLDDCSTNNIDFKTALVIVSRCALNGCTVFF